MLFSSNAALPTTPTSSLAEAFQYSLFLTDKTVRTLSTSDLYEEPAIQVASTSDETRPPFARRCHSEAKVAEIPIPTTLATEHKTSDRPNVQADNVHLGMLDHMVFHHVATSGLIHPSDNAFRCNPIECKATTCWWQTSEGQRIWGLTWGIKQTVLLLERGNVSAARTLMKQTCPGFIERHPGLIGRALCELELIELLRPSQVHPSAKAISHLSHHLPLLAPPHHRPVHPTSVQLQRMHKLMQDKELPETAAFATEDFTHYETRLLSYIYDPSLCAGTGAWGSRCVERGKGIWSMDRRRWCAKLVASAMGRDVWTRVLEEQKVQPQCDIVDIRNDEFPRMVVFMAALSSLANDEQVMVEWVGGEQCNVQGCAGLHDRDAEVTPLSALIAHRTHIPSTVAAHYLSQHRHSVHSFLLYASRQGLLRLRQSLSVPSSTVSLQRNDDSVTTPYSTFRTIEHDDILDALVLDYAFSRNIISATACSFQAGAHPCHHDGEKVRRDSACIMNEPRRGTADELHRDSSNWLSDVIARSQQCEQDGPSNPSAAESILDLLASHHIYPVDGTPTSPSSQIKGDEDMPVFSNPFGDVHALSASLYIALLYTQVLELAYWQKVNSAWRLVREVMSPVTIHFPDTMPYLKRAVYLLTKAGNEQGKDEYKQYVKAAWDEFNPSHLTGSLTSALSPVAGEADPLLVLVLSQGLEEWTRAGGAIETDAAESEPKRHGLTDLERAWIVNLHSLDAYALTSQQRNAVFGTRPIDVQSISDAGHPTFPTEPFSSSIGHDTGPVSPVWPIHGPTAAQDIPNRYARVRRKSSITISPTSGWTNLSMSPSSPSTFAKSASMGNPWLDSADFPSLSSTAQPDTKASRRRKSRV
ncbi:hypothetical protein BZG36_04299 [Bifiguratus adelaidae]|uniref:Uncharacterized protein n=1 Tax=Bifiguratus adelaidae TaxID=1938954 RepID=A0A261XZR5_9FUNG|nr:hypothetical protein BZG36_04299 [Bifiguratus adelaidae]